MLTEYKDLQKNLKDQKPLKRYQILKMLDVMLQLHPFNISWQNILGSINPFSRCKTCYYNKRNWKQDVLLGKAERKLRKELDIIDLLKGVNQAKIGLKSILSRK